MKEILLSFSFFFGNLIAAATETEFLPRWDLKILKPIGLYTDSFKDETN